MRTIFTFFSLAVFIASCSSTDTQSTPEIASTDYMSLGDSIATASQQALLKEVSDHMQTVGVVGTITYCNENALRITDSLSNKYNVEISRISQKNRNPQNGAGRTEQTILSQFEAGTSRDAIVETGEGTVYYKAIHLGMPACIKCHGVPNKDIPTEALHVIDSLYPNDLARNYQFGEFRGAWKIRFNKD